MSPDSFVTICPTVQISRVRLPVFSHRRSGISPARRFKQFDRIACRVVEQDLLAPHAGDDVVSEMGSSLAQRRDFTREVVDLKLYAVPAAWLGLATIGHGLGGAPET